MDDDEVTFPQNDITGERLYDMITATVGVKVLYSFMW